MGDIEGKKKKNSYLNAEACLLAIGRESNRDCLIMNVRAPEITSVTDLTNKELTQRWKDIDWKRVKEVVNNLQSRICKCSKERKLENCEQTLPSSDPVLLCQTSFST
jgi:RNA-directed DNA polymerase